ncbi:MAG: 4-hydroxy-tetrahydrodipicolinate reductase [Acidimicrobiales bacterium]|jgi:4-hydroxy-tetrahydrodipicolinate reductase
MKRIAIVGGAGRMGQVLSSALGAMDDVTVVALVDVQAPAQLSGAQHVTSIDGLDPGTVDVVVDFSTPEGAAMSARWCAQHGVALVIGTTGLGDAERDAVHRASESTGIVMATNFSLGVVLQQRFAAMAAPYFERVEIIELHHDRKVDSPSGTSLTTAHAIADARREAGLAPLADPTSRHSIEGTRGGDGADGVRIHSVRLPGLVSHQEVLFGGPGEGLTIRHDSFDRLSFVAGVALAVRAVGATPGLTEGIDSLVV